MVNIFQSIICLFLYTPFAFSEQPCGQYPGQNSAKAFLPFKDFIFEVLNAQKKIDRKEAEKYFQEANFTSCVNEYMTDKNLKVKKLDWAKEYCIKSTKEYPKYYQHLDHYPRGKALLKFLQSYKDFGVNDDE